MSERHGEYKLPGGKLTAADVTIEHDRLQAVRIRGDFFINPEPQTLPTLAAIADALVRLPISISLAALAAHIQTATPYGVELLGTSPDAIARAVRRAIGHDDAEIAIANEPSGDAQAYSLEEWRKYAWRLLPEVPLSAAMNVALDEVLTDRVATGASPPTLRFWRWSEQAVIIGRCQSVVNEVDRDAAQAMGVQVVRRLTGGGAMFLQPHGAITYSLYLPEDAVAGLTIRQSYALCESWIIRGLRELGVDAHHVPINDIACSAGKIGGAAQARRRGVVLHHTTMAYDMNPGEMVRVLRIGREKLKDKAVASAAKRVSPLVQQTGLSRDAIVAALFAGFQRQFGGTVDTLTADELANACQLVETKYAHKSWTYEMA
jgi:lipoate---protein ligase